LFQAPAGLDTFVYSYYFGVGHVEQFNFAFLYGQAFQSHKIITTGFLSSSGAVLQNQCRYVFDFVLYIFTYYFLSLNGTTTNNYATVTPYGIAVDPITTVNVPQGFLIDCIFDHIGLSTTRFCFCFVFVLGFVFSFSFIILFLVFVFSFRFRFGLKVLLFFYIICGSLFS
jgi:hypothetical protein